MEAGVSGSPPKTARGHVAMTHRLRSASVTVLLPATVEHRVQAVPFDAPAAEFLCAQVI